MQRTLQHRIASFLYAHASRTPVRTLLFALAALATMTVIGTLGYHWLEPLGWVDALYLSITTLSTVGYGDVVPTTSAGRVFSMVLIMFGLGTVFYTVGAVAEFLLEGRLGGLLWRNAMLKTLAGMEDHVVVCGYGRFGRVVAHELKKQGAPFVVIDPDPELEAGLIEEGILHVVGSALEDSVLETAAVAKARAIVVAMPDDSDSLFVTLSARQLNSRIHIHARAETDTGAKRLRMAGADQIISPHRLGGQRMANALLRPAVVDFMELLAESGGEGVDLEELIIGEHSALDGLQLLQLGAQEVEVGVVAIKSAEQPVRLSPSGRSWLHAGDRIIAVGERDQLKRLSELAKAGETAE